ncbi:thermostable hemolysin [Paracoccus sediminilitoris]|uniref:thermostable hemolysin n=1 Tax=Paracoccus sediminilitoris TaxID=2202419 RepID=UPI000DBA0C6E|nr:thermostable hemolysin [Paracoccus sediminilitoris]
MQVDILDWRDPGWHAAAAMIGAHFHATHGAQVTLPALPLAVATGAQGRILGAAGLRDAGRGFFSQVYLDRPVATELSRLSDSPVAPGDVIEVVSMACPTPAATLPLIEAITAEGRRRGASWGLFTATGPLMRMLRRTGVPIMPLAPARPDRLPDASRWGRYYDTDPWVCALQECTQPLRFMPRRATPLTEVHPK